MSHPSRLLSPQPRPGHCEAADVLKAIAIVGVLLIHTSSAGYSNPVYSLDWLSAIVWGTLPRPSVPIFCMVSGALMLDPSYSLPLKKLWTRKIPRLLVSLWFWSFAYHIYRLVFVTHEGIHLAGLLQSLRLTVLFQYEFHLYFLHMFLLVYALLPMTRLAAAHADRRTLEYLLGVWAVTAILWPTFQNVWPISAAEPIFGRYLLSSTYAYVGYGLLGWYLKQYARRGPHWLVMILIGFALSLASVIIPSWQAGVLVEGKLSGTDLGIALMAAGICGWVFSNYRDCPAPQTARILAKASFGIYLVHVFYLYALQDLGFTANTGPCIIFVPLTAAVILVCSLGTWFILDRIPVFRSWCL